ncbi:MAG: hypothetical protein MUO80_07470, partial [Dehalococcoidia bacterium]|nr:hypothetical protein [Dehalococcoidia bacterium]
LAEGIIGILSFGIFTTHLALSVCEFFHRRRDTWGRKEGSLVEVELKTELECPRCKGKKFQLGPRGGVAQNIRCVCGCELNVTRFPDGRFFVEELTEGGEQ